MSDFWNILSSFGTVVALASIYVVIKQSKKQLEIEQEPYVVVDGEINLVDLNMNKLTLKNVGRASAMRVTCSYNIKKKDTAFFEDSESHTEFLFANETKSKKIETSIIPIIHKYKPAGIKLFIFYESQIGGKYMTTVMMKQIPDKLIVMENFRVKL